MPQISDSIGRVLGKRYRLVATLGAGASAHVYLAEDVSLQRHVAVKVLQPALTRDQSFLKRFGAEARSVASLNHPHVLRVFDWGEDADGPYLVLEYLGGGSLRDLLDSGYRLSHAQAARLGAQAAQGLAYAHARGLVHRDVKPANLLFDEEGRVRIADFGVARALAEASWTEPAGAMIGTARYASPEQAEGRAVDGRADVYSLALVLFEALSGDVPFVTDTTIGTLTARVGAALPRHPALGPLDDTLARAAAPEVAARVDAGQLAARLEALSIALPAPEPLPLHSGDDIALADAPLRSVRGFRAPGIDELTGSVPRVTGPAAAGAAAGAAVSPAPNGPSGPANGPSGPANGPSGTPNRPASPASSMEPAAMDRGGGPSPAAGAALVELPPVARAGPGEVFDVEALEDVPPTVHSAPAEAPAFAAPTAVPTPAAPTAVPAASAAPTAVPTPTAPGASPPLAGQPAFFVAPRVSPSTTSQPAAAAPSAGPPSVGAPSTGAHVASGAPPPIVRRRRRRRWPWVVGVCVVVAALVAAGLIWATRNKVFTPSHPVPALTNLTVAGARQALAADHLTLSVGAPVFSITVPSGKVVSQHPAPRTPMKEGGTVAIVPSRGLPPEAFPSLLGLNCSAAQKVLAAYHLVGLCPDAAAAYSTSVPQGQVINWSWENQVNVTNAPYGSTVLMAISKGPPPVTLADYSGETYGQAAAALQALGLQPTQTSQQSTGVPAGQVMGTSPAAGQPVPAGSTVTVIVSSGAPPPPPPPTTQVVPDVEGEGTIQANLDLVAAGFTLQKIVGPVDAMVVSQVPAPGAQAPPGTAVILTTQ